MKPNRVMGLVLGGLIVVVAAVAIVVAVRPAPELDPTSPEGAVQSYLKAFLDDDMEEAVTWLAPALSCEPNDLFWAGYDESVRVALIDVTVNGDSARVTTEMAFGGGGPFSDEYSEEHTFRLERVDDRWLISSPPWPVFGCEGGR